MGTIYRNGTAFIGSGGAGGVELTQAEYDALPETEKMNGSIYFISDGEASYPSASTMRYDNSTSGLTATSVQAAVDEVNEKVNDNAGDIAELNDKYYYKDYDFTLSFAAGTPGTRGAQGSYPLDTGATAVGCIITYVASSDRYIPIVFTSGSSGAGPSIYCNLYRSDSSACDSRNQVSARVLYRRS